MPTSVASRADAASDLDQSSYLSGTWSSSTQQASYRLPTQATCELAAALADRVPGVSDPSPGGIVRRFGLVISPGTLRIKSTMRGDDSGSWDEALDYLDAERGPARITAATMRVAGASTGTKTVITSWSRKSRLNMARTLATLDWADHIGNAPAGWRPQMLTLTLPGDWLAVAPDGATFKRLFQAWLKRWKRQFGTAWAGAWKLEFQGRGAPHLHLYGNAPTGLAFREWLSQSWYDVCGSGDERHLRAGTGVDWREGIRGTDPRSVALYFLGKSVGHNLGLGKEYQHVVPEAWREPGKGPGRFWGHRGLVRVEVLRELDDVMYLRLRRLVRRWAKANGRKINAAGWSRYQGYTLLHADAPAWLSQALRWDLLGGGDAWDGTMRWGPPAGSLP